MQLERVRVEGKRKASKSRRIGLPIGCLFGWADTRGCQAVQSTTMKIAGQRDQQWLFDLDSETITMVGSRMPP